MRWSTHLKPADMKTKHDINCSGLGKILCICCSCKEWFLCDQMENTQRKILWFHFDHDLAFALENGFFI